MKLGGLWSDESGQAITEYVLILGAAVFGAVTLMRGLLGSLDRGILRVGASLEKDLKSGKMPVGFWKN